MKLNYWLTLAAMVLFLCPNFAKNTPLSKNHSSLISNQKDTIDPEQRVPFGTSRPVPKRIPATATTEKFEARVDPSSWWVGFKKPTVELTFHDVNISQHTVVIKHKGLTVKSIHRPENANYLFVTLNVSPTAALGDVNIQLAKGSDKRNFKWRLDKRRFTEGGRNQGLTTADFIYLIMPDRFANGDYSNDDIPALTQRGIDRRKMFFRHGGDLKGIENNLDYLKDLGATALWLNPVQENDEPYESYHGYAMTDLYRIDRRFGTNEDYKKLVEAAHAKGLKMVMDIAPNHFGHNHYTIKDLPETTWIHQFDSFTRTTYRDQVVFDPYVAQSEKDIMVKGWFDLHMPDMNPEGNPRLKNYIIQSYLWWLEYSGLDAFRIDTYLYNDPQFMAEMGQRVRSEFPRLHLFGETWVTGNVNQAYSTEGVGFGKKFDSKMQGVTDFQLYHAITEALTREQGWTEGIMKIYQNLANDLLYKNGYANVTFIDNHDIARFYSVVGEDKDKYKSAIAWLLTCRGIPQWYYGAELGYTGFTNPDGKVRQDMIGGWKEDPRSVFTQTGRTEKENELHAYVRKLANWRKTKSCLHDGKLTQYVPVNGVYVFFRHDAASSVMVVMNTHGQPTTLDTKRFSERLAGFKSAKNVVTEGVLSDLSKLNLGRFETLVLELQR
jgi:neopullulanase